MWNDDGKNKKKKLIDKLDTNTTTEIKIQKDL